MIKINVEDYCKFFDKAIFEWYNQELKYIFLQENALSYSELLTLSKKFKVNGIDISLLDINPLENARFIIRTNVCENGKYSSKMISEKQ